MLLWRFLKRLLGHDGLNPAKLSSMNSKKLLNHVLGIALGGICLSAVSAFSQIEIASTTYGGDSYELWQSPGISWAQAEANAVSLGGTLAVLTSSAQTTAVYGNLIGNGFFQSSGGLGAEAWLGALPAVPDSNGGTTDPNNWAWVTGAPWTSFDAGNFDPGEPNGDANSGLGINLDGIAKWNDEGNTGEIGGYIVEKLVPSVPDGGLAIAMLGTALSGLAFIRRKL
jgi:hypothetical protein